MGYPLNRVTVNYLRRIMEENGPFPDEHAPDGMSRVAENRDKTSDPSSADSNTDTTPSTLVAKFHPKEDDQQERKQKRDPRFEGALQRTIEGTSAGELTPYLFFDPAEDVKNTSDADLVHGWGSQAWDEHVTGSWADVKKSADKEDSNDYAFTNEDSEALYSALEAGLLKRLPASLTYVSMGPGDVSAFSNKDMQLLNALVASKKHVVRDAITVDICQRYAADSAHIIYDHFNNKIPTEGHRYDFMEGEPDSQLDPKGTPLITVFGGSICNAPEHKDGLSAKENAVRYYTKLRETLPGAHIIMTVDTCQDPALLEASYAPNPAFERFTLSGLMRGKMQGIIRNRSYNGDKIFEKWRMVSHVEDQGKDGHVVHLAAQCKKDHILKTTFGDYRIKEGQELAATTLSHKWTLAVHQQLLDQAGYDSQIIHLRDSGTAVIHAKSRDICPLPQAA